jgi:ureidoglycolate lyase
MGEPLVLPVRELTDEAFAPFGRVLAPPARDRDAEGPGWRWWAETLVLDPDPRPWSVGYLQLEPAPPARFDWAERHLRSPEAIVPVAGGCLVYVGPSDDTGPADRLPPPESFEVFRLTPGTGVVMDRGVWHGAPLVEGVSARAIVLLLEGTGRDDVTIVRFPDEPIMVGEG